MDEDKQKDEIEMPDIPADVSESTSNPASDVSSQPKKSQFNLKYYCNGCSGRAFLSEEKEKFDVRTCQTCGANVYYNEGNYLPLSDNEKQTLNG